MSTTPPTDPGTPGPGTPGPGPGTPGPGPGTPGPDPSALSSPPDPGRPGVGPYTQISNFDVARMPIPGNAEFLVLVLIEAFLAILLLDDAWNTNDWAFASTILGAAYLLSRGIAKASRVLEQ